MEATGTKRRDWIRCAATWALLRVVAGRGIEPRKVLAAAGGIELPEDRSERILLTDHFAVWTAAMRAVRDPGLPVDVGASLRIEDLELLGYALRSAPDLSTALGVVERFGRLQASDNSLESRREGDRVRVFLPPTGPLPLAARAGTECVITQAMSFARQITQSEFRPLEVSFRHPRPSSTTRHEVFFGVAPVFGAELASLVFSTEDLDRPVRQADATLHRVLLRQAESDLAALPVDSSFTEKVRRAVTARLPSGVPSVEGIGAQVGCSARTLRRRLEEEGVSFRALVDETRSDLARRYLLSDQLGTEEVALLLGFSDARAFRRAHRRWFGASPREARRDAPSGRADP